MVSEKNAKTSETNAKVSETASKNSETNAKVSETASKNSETNASKSCENAIANANQAASVLGGATTALYESTGAGIISGFDATISGSTINIKAGTAHMVTGYRETVADTTITPNIADTTNPRIDLIYLSNTGVVSYLAGVAVARPAIPSVPDGGLGLWCVDVSKDGTLALIDVRKTKISTQKSINHINSISGKISPEYKRTVGINMGWSPFTDDFMSKIASIGAGYVRVGFTWSAVEKVVGVYNFSYFDYMCKQMLKNDMKIVCLLGYGNSIYETNGITTPAGRTAFANYAVAAANYLRTKGFTDTVFEIWNEPNVESFWSGSATSYTNYVALTKVVYPQLKAADDTALCAVGALSWGVDHAGTLYGYEWLQSALSLGLANYCDLISLHYYVSDKPEIYTAHTESAYRLIGQYTDKNIKLLVSEQGYSTNPNFTAATKIGVAVEADRAKYIPRALLNNLSNNVFLSCIYHGVDNHTDAATIEDWFGIFIGTSTQTPTETAINLQILKTALGGYYFEKTILKTATATVMLFSDKSYAYKVAGWTTDPSGETVAINGISFDITDSVTITSIDDAIAEKMLKNLGKDYRQVGKSTVCTLGEIFNDYRYNTASGQYSHAEGYNNTASGQYSHVEGALNTVSGTASSTHGKYNNISGNYAYAGGYSNRALGDDSIAVGMGNLSQELYTTAFGLNNTALKYCSVAAGNGNIVGNQAVGMGYQNISCPGSTYTIIARDAGAKTITLSTTPSDISIGTKLPIYMNWDGTLVTTVTAISGALVTVDIAPSSAWLYAVVPSNTTVGSLAIGFASMATNMGASAFGIKSKSTGSAATAAGYGVFASNLGSLAVGHYNKPMTGGGTYDNTTGDAFVIGNGNPSVSSNAFRVNYAGATYGLSAFNSTGADYAEFFEWSDDNPDSEDRVGYFVTFDTGLKIRKAESTDDYILGIVSGAPSIIGNSYQDDWTDKYAKDAFGRIEYEEIEFAALTDADGNIMKPSYMGLAPKISANYDASKEYTPREKRKEWSAVGVLGQLAVYDDGTCTVDSYCKPSDDGKATAAANGYRVIERISSNVIKILFR